MVAIHFSPFPDHPTVFFLLGRFAPAAVLARERLDNVRNPSPRLPHNAPSFFFRLFDVFSRPSGRTGAFNPRFGFFS